MKIFLFAMLFVLVLSGCTETETNTQPANVVQASSCPDDGTTTIKFIYEDTLSSSLSYDDPTVYLLPKTSGQKKYTDNSLVTTGDYSTGVSVPCLSTGTQWQAVAVTKQDECHSAVSENFVADGAEMSIDFRGKAFDVLQIRVEDKVTGGRKYFDIASCGTTDGGYHALAGTQCVVQDSTSTVNSLTLGTDDYIEAKIYIKTNHTKRQFGEDGLKVYLLVDANTNEWMEPEVSRGNGPVLSNMIQNLAEYDRRYYTNHEYAYSLGSFDGMEDYIEFYMLSADGVNPSTDPVLEFCAEGRYLSSKERDSIKVGCWTDASSQAEVATGSRQYFKFDIS